MITEITSIRFLIGQFNPTGSTTLDIRPNPVEQVIAETIVADPSETPPLEDELDPRVLKGVLYLDEHYPGWADRINLQTFCLSSSESCVVGQLYGNYGINNVAKCFGVEHDGSEKSRNHIWDIGAEYGTMIDHDRQRNGDTTYPALEADWRKAIKARQAK